MSARQTGAGDLDQRVRIEKPEQAEVEGGSYETTWALVATVWADAWTVSGRERVEAQQEQASTMARFKIRRRTDVTAGMRVIWQGKAHNIRFIADNGPRDPFVIIDAEAGVPL